MDWKVHKLKEGIYMITMTDKETRFFEALWEIPEGIQYNAYLLFTNDGSILFDTGPKGSRGFMEALSSVTDPKDVKSLIVHHMEPDHSGYIRELLEVNPEIRVISHPISFRLMNSFYGITPSSKTEISDGMSMEVGGERLRFFLAPWLHWPETFVTFIEGVNALTTGDIFGAYSINGDFLKSSAGLSDQFYLWSMKKYFVNVIGAYRTHVVNAINKIKRLGIYPELILPAHGIAFYGRDALERLLSIYENWASCSEKNEVVIVLTSMYGFTEEIAREVSAFLEEVPIKHRIFKFTSKGRDEFSEAIAAMQNAQGIIMISSTYENSPHPIIEYLADLMEKKLCRGKKLLLIGTYAWGGGSLATLSNRLTKAGFSISKIIPVNSMMTKSDRDNIREALREMFELTRF
jgi:flavorubredoxin